MIKSKIYRSASYSPSSQYFSIEGEYRKNLREDVLEKINVSSARKEVFLRCVDLLSKYPNSAKFIDSFLEKFGIEKKHAKSILEYCHHQSSYFGWFYTKSAYQLLVDLKYPYVDYMNVTKYFSFKIQSHSFCDLDLSYLNLKGLNLEMIDLSRSTLKNTNLTGARLVGAKFDETNLHGASLEGAKFGRAVFHNTILIDSNLDYVNLQSAILIGTDLNNTKLSGRNLNFANFTRAELNEANLGDAILDSATFEYASMRGANLTRASLLGTKFNYANLSGANLSKTKLDATSFSYANLDNAKLMDVAFGVVNFDYSTFNNTELTIDLSQILLNKSLQLPKVYKQVEYTLNVVDSIPNDYLKTKIKAMDSIIHQLSYLENHINLEIENHFKFINNILSKEHYRKSTIIPDFLSRHNHLII